MGYLSNPAHMAHLEYQLTSRRQEVYQTEATNANNLMNLNVPRAPSAGTHDAGQPANPPQQVVVIASSLLPQSTIDFSLLTGSLHFSNRWPTRRW